MMRIAECAWDRPKNWLVKNITAELIVLCCGVTKIVIFKKKKTKISCSIAFSLKSHPSSHFLTWLKNQLYIGWEGFSGK